MPAPKRTSRELALARHLGQGLRAARRERKMKGHVLAESIGISQQALSLIETGKTIPSWPTLFALARELKFDLWYFLKPIQLIQWRNYE